MIQRILFMLIVHLIGVTCASDKNENSKSTDSTKIKYEENLIQAVENQGEIYLEEDCRCEMAKVKFFTNKMNSYISFTYCDTVYESGMYKITKVINSNTSDTYIVMVKNSEKPDTIRICRPLRNKKIFRIWRSNTDGSTKGYFFIPESNSSKYEHLDINCDDDQG